MAANLSQALIENAGIVPSLVQELVAGNFHDGRESLHDFIYSRFLLGEEKSNSAGSKPGAPVFPNQNLINSYASSLPVLNSPYSLASNNGQLEAENDIAGNAGGEESPTLNIPSLNKSQKPDTAKKLPEMLPGGGHQIRPGGSEGERKLKKKSHHKKKEKTNICDVCGRGFAEKYTLTRHMLTHTRVKPYSCSKCNMSFSRSDGLAKHMAAGHRRIDSHHCDVCGGTFNSELSFEQHRREYGSTLPFVCNLCMLAFSQCCHLNYHMKSHPLSKLNDGLGYDDQDSKNNAIDVSELVPEDFSPPKKDYDAQAGGFLASLNKMGAEGHLSKNLFDPNIIIKPEVEDFSGSGTLKPLNSGDKSEKVNGGALDNFTNTFVSQAGNNFSATSSESTPSYLSNTSKNLDMPSSSQTNMIPDSEMKKYYDIKVPNLRYLVNSDHQLSSVSEDGLFKCEVCGKGFTRKYHMQRHVKLHTRGPIPRAHLLDWTRRPYACGVCKMGFTRQHHLTRHILIHTGERPHSCHICEKAFRRYTNLTLHIRTVHGSERPFKCHICERGFPRLYSLQRHLKLHAKNAAAALVADRPEQVYTGFQVVGTVDVEKRLSQSYSGINLSHLQESPEVSSDSDTSDHDSDNYKESNTEVINLGHSETVRFAAHMITQNKFAFSHPKTNASLQNEQLNWEKYQKNHLPDGNENGEGLIGLNKQQQILPPTKSGNIGKISHQVSSERGVTHENTLLSRVTNSYIASGRHSDATKGFNSLSLRSITDFNAQQGASGTLSEATTSNQNMRMLNENFREPNLTETKNFSQKTQAEDKFACHHHQVVQSPLPSVNTFERSRSTTNQEPMQVTLPSIQMLERPSSATSLPLAQSPQNLINVLERPRSTTNQRSVQSPQHIGMLERPRSTTNQSPSQSPQHMIGMLERPRSTTNQPPSQNSQHMIGMQERPRSTTNQQPAQSPQHVIGMLERPRSTSNQPPPQSPQHSNNTLEQPKSTINQSHVQNPQNMIDLLERPRSTTNHLPIQNSQHMIDLLERYQTTSNLPSIQIHQHMVDSLGRPQSTINKQSIQNPQNMLNMLERPRSTNNQPHVQNSLPFAGMIKRPTSTHPPPVQSPLPSINMIERPASTLNPSSVQSPLPSVSMIDRPSSTANQVSVKNAYSATNANERLSSTMRQPVQSPLPSIHTLERSGSRSMIDEVAYTYNHLISGFNQTQAQQHISINFPFTHSTATSSSVTDNGSYSHNSLVNISVNQNSVSDSSVYSHNHNLNSLPFPVDALRMYQPNISTNVNQINQNSCHNTNPATSDSKHDIN